MLDKGIICCSASQWSSPLHMVRKKGGTLRLCSDYCHLNLQIVKDKYPLPNMVDLASQLVGYMVFSKMDLCEGYLQMLMAADIAKTAIIAPFSFLSSIA
jgi:hypothetical protein